MAATSFVDTGGGIPSAYASARQVLTDYGLASLLPWFMTQVKAGATPDELLLNMRQTPEFKAAFPEIDALSSQGKPPVSVNDILNYRATAYQLGGNAGLPRGFLNDANIGALMVGQVSPAELASRIVDGAGKMLSADTNVQRYFADTFGADGPGALTAWFLDPDHAENLLAQQLTEAQIGGSSRDFGYAVDPATVHRFAAQGITPAQADAGFAQMSKIASLFATLPAESSVGAGGLGAAPVDQTTGAEALVGKNAVAMDAVSQRLDARQAAAAGQVGIEEDQTHGFRGLGVNL